MTTLLQHYRPFLPVIAGTLFFAVFGLLFFLTSRRAIASNRGGLAWIRRYGKAGFLFDAQALTSYHKDWLCIFGAEVFSLLVTILYALALSRYTTGSWFEGFFRFQTLLRALAALIGTAAAYLLLQDLFDDNLLSTCGAMVFTAARLHQHSMHCILMLSLFLLFRYLLTDPRERLFPRELLYWGAVVTLCLAAYFGSRILYLAPFYMGLHIYLCVRRAKAARTAAPALAGPGLGLLIWPLGLVLLCAAVYLLYFGRPMAALLGSVSEAVWSSFRVSVLSLFSAPPPLLRSRLLNPMIDAPLAVLGLFGLLRSISAVRDRHDPRGLMILCVNGVLFLLWALSGTYALLPGLLLSLGFVWDCFTQSGKKGPVLGCGLLFMVYYIALHGAAYLVPLYSELVYRIT